MTDVVYPSPDRSGNAYQDAVRVQSGAISEGWVAPTDTSYLASTFEALTQSRVPLNGFTYRSGQSSGLDAYIDHGEAFVSGANVCRDQATTITLADNTSAQTVYLGFDPTGRDRVLVGLDGAFPEHPTPRVPIWTVSTSSGAITSVTDERTVGPTIDVVNQRYEGGSDHASATDNPHQVSAQQVGALPTSGGVVDGAVRINSGVWPTLGDDAHSESDDPTTIVSGYTTFRDAAGTFPLGTNSIVETVNPEGESNARQFHWNGQDDRFYVRTAGSAWRELVTADMNGTASATRLETTEHVAAGGQLIRDGLPAIVSHGGVRDIYVQSSEPSGWSDGDLWFDPQ